MAEITIQDLMLGNSTLIKNKQYLSTKAYVEPFIERMSAYTKDFKIQVKSADQVSVQNQVENQIYNRVLIQAILPPSYYSEDNHQKVVGMVYGLDVKTPVVKIYAGGLNMACTNLCVFSPDYLNVQELEPGAGFSYAPIKQVMEMTDNLTVMLKTLKSQYLNSDNMREQLGNWIDFTLRESYNPSYGKIKIASSTPIEVYKNLFINTESPYYTPQGIEPSLFDVYNAFTDVIRTDSKDLLNKYEKVYLVSKMLGL